MPHFKTLVNHVYPFKLNLSTQETSLKCLNTLTDSVVETLILEHAMTCVGHYHHQQQRRM